MTGLKSRIVCSLAAYGAGQVVNLVVQLASVPLFLTFWGNQLYGEWLLLTTIPAYLSVSDLRFATTGTTEMANRIGTGDYRAALECYQTVWLLVCSLCSGGALLVFLSLSFVPFQAWLSLKEIARPEALTVLLILGAQTIVTQLFGLFLSVFQADSRNARSSIWTSGQRVFEFAAVAGAIVLGAQPLVLAVVGLGSRLVCLAALWRDVCIQAPWATIGWRHASWSCAKRLANPALASMGYPIGFALRQQGLVAIVGSLLGPAQVVVFSVLRTMTTAPYQLMSAVASAFWPELSRAFGSGQIDLVRRMHRRLVQIAIASSLAMILALLLTGPWILHIWTRGRVTMDYGFFYALLSVLLVSSIWFSSGIIAISVNKHQSQALAYLVGAGICCLLSSQLIPRWGLVGAAVSLLAIDATMIGQVFRQSLTLTQDRLMPFLLSLLTPPRLHKVV